MGSASVATAKLARKLYRQTYEEAELKKWFEAKHLARALLWMLFFAFLNSCGRSSHQNLDSTATSPSPYVRATKPAPAVMLPSTSPITRTPWPTPADPQSKISNLQTSSIAKSGVHYRIYTEGEKVWLSFQRPGDPDINDKRQLLYFIGSGRRGPQLSVAVDDFFFESPVNWYADRKSLGYGSSLRYAREIPIELARLRQLPGVPHQRDAAADPRHGEQILRALFTRSALAVSRSTEGRSSHRRCRSPQNYIDH